MSESTVMRARIRRWTAAGAILLAATAAGIPAATAASAAPAKAVSAASAKSAASPKSASSATRHAARPAFSLPEQYDLNGAFVPVSPVRVLDTRSGVGTGGLKAKVGQNVIALDVSGITGNPSVQPTAVVLNVTVVAPTKNTYVEVYPNGDAAPGTSNLNVPGGGLVANQVTVQVGVDGMVDFYNADGQTDIVADLAGYYTLDEAASNYVPDGPHRILDTRHGIGGITGPIGADKSVSLQVTGVQGVPATGVTAVVLNVTAIDPSRTTYLTVYPDGTSVPVASSLNVGGGGTQPNLVTVQVGAGGKVDFFNDLGDVQVAADLAGYYTDTSAQTGGVFQSAGPTRIMDTRVGTGGITGPIGPGKSVSLKVAGLNGVPSSGATAVVLNVTAISPTSTSYLTVYPNGESTPATSNLNFTAGQTIPNLVIVPIGANGDVNFFNDLGDVQVAVDLFGYFDAGSDLNLSAVGFSDPTVDASSDGAAQTVNFTVTDSDQAALGVNGELVIRQFGTTPNTYVGQPLVVEFNEGANVYNGATFVSGTPASSTYSYTFGVPEYAGAASMKWGVSLASIFDYPGSQQLVLAGSALSGPGDTFTATEQVSSVTPSYQDISVSASNALGDQLDMYDGALSFPQYNLMVQDGQSGVASGSLTITGPGGITATAPFSAYADPAQVQNYPCQGDDQTLTDEMLTCTPIATIPADAPAGTWAVTSVSLTNNAGQTQVYSDLDLAPITVTSDGVIQASAFKVTPTQVDNWTANATATVSMDITGAKDGVSSIQLYTYDGASDGCRQQSTTPTVSGDVYSLPITVYQVIQNSSLCQIAGIAITDGAGDLSLYGIDFTPTDLGLKVTNVPDTTPPVALSATMSLTSIAQSNLADDGGEVYATVQTKTLVAPVDEASSTVYDSSGDAVAELSGGASVNAQGQLMVGLGLPFTLPVGTYTVTFSLTDAAGLTTSYGGKGQTPVPGGPLTFAVTAG